MKPGVSTSVSGITFGEKTRKIIGRVDTPFFVPVSSFVFYDQMLGIIIQKLKIKYALLFESQH